MNAFVDSDDFFADLDEHLNFASSGSRKFAWKRELNAGRVDIRWYKEL